MSATIAVGTSNEQAISLVEAAKRLPISEFKLRQLVRSGAILSTRVGRIHYLFPSDIRRSSIGSLWME
jgi:excisionase family DNA binding protein